MWKIFSDKASNLEITHKCVITYSLTHLDCHCSASAYQPCSSSGWQLIGHNVLMKGRGMVAAQHKWYFWKKGNLNKPREIFSSQLITQLMAWRAVGEEVILFTDVN
jgi:hypothetical protein